MLRLLEGLSKFQQEVYPQHREMFEDLAAGQSPEALLVTCADSRIDPCMLTQTKPGELFICRNAGNMVPAYGDSIGGVSATIEFAVTALGVKDIIVCGHSDCGAMKGLLHPEKVAKMPAVASWLKYGDAARAAALENYAHLDEQRMLETVTQLNVLAQLDNLRTHPSVSARLRRGALRLHGWVYKIGTGEVQAWDARSDRFVHLHGKLDGLIAIPA